MDLLGYGLSLPMASHTSEGKAMESTEPNEIVQIRRMLQGVENDRVTKQFANPERMIGTEYVRVLLEAYDKLRGVNAR